MLLEDMFNRQKQLQQKINTKYKNKQEEIDKMFIGIITESCEAIENTNWKPWKQENMFNEIKLQKEIIDIWHFLINLSILAGLTPQQIYTMYINKNNINKRRQDNGY